MKTLPAGLAALIATGATTLCTCWRIARRDGAVFGFTDHDRALIFGGVTYAPETGFVASEIESALGLQVDTMEVEGALTAAIITEGDIALGRWDDADAEIWRVDWSNTANRVITRKGSIGEILRGDIAFSAEIRGLAHYLNQEQGRTYARICDAVVGDARCKIALGGGTYTGTGTVTATSDARYVVASGLGAFADGWFTQGVLTWTTGGNTGAAVEIRRHGLDAGAAQLTLWQRAARPVVIGDTFSVSAGCDKTFGTCGAKFANGANFRGFPHFPGNDFVLGVAKRSHPNDGGSFFS